MSRTGPKKSFLSRFNPFGRRKKKPIAASRAKRLAIEPLEVRSLLSVSGSVLHTLYSFSGGAGGQNPYGSLTLASGTLYGMTNSGGTVGQGNVFSIAADGSSYQDLCDFTNSEYPYGNVTLVSGTLYGMTYDGGTSQDGNVFSVPTADGSSTDMHSFSMSGDDGGLPMGSLTASADGQTLYGMTTAGGTFGDGTVFAIASNASAPLWQTSFNGTNGNFYGDFSFNSLTLSADGSTLYGTAQAGGDNGVGAVFSVSTGDHSIKKLYSFSLAGGYNPDGPLTLVGNTLYGTTYSGGAHNDGEVFSVGASGGNFHDVYDFGGSADGANPSGDLTLSADGGALYGMTCNGGADADGAIFSIPTLQTVYSFSGEAGGQNPYGSLTLAGGTLYGMTNSGGTAGQGNVFSIAADGSSYQDLCDFTNSEYPYGNVTLVDHTLYGMTYDGGTNQDGNVFSVPDTGGSSTDMHSFAFNASDGGLPMGSLTASGDGQTLYGMTTAGGAGSHGTVFAIAADATDASQLLWQTPFTGSNGNFSGYYSFNSLTLSADGSTLYGTTQAGGANGCGNIFSVSTSNGAITSLYSFSGGAGGYSPDGPLTLVGNTLYGTTQGTGGGSGAHGTVFSVNIDDSNGIQTLSGFQTLVGFTGGSGAYPGHAPMGGLTLVGDTLYGTTYSSGAHNYGEVFSVGTGGGNFHDVYDFTDGLDGAYPSGDLTLSADGDTLYGMTTAGGAYGDGALFSIAIPAPSVTTNPSDQAVDDGDRATFTAAASGTPAPSVQWEVNTGSGFTTLSDGGLYSGSSTGTLTISGATAAMSSYQYEAVFTNSVGTATTMTATLTVTAASSTASAATLLGSSANPSLSGQSVTFTATVAPTTGNAVPTGSVDFFNGSTDLELGQVAITDGVASLTTTFSVVGSDRITATYEGDSNYASSSANLQELVQTASTTSLASSASASQFGQAVTFTATVASTGTGTPSGEVEFFDSGVYIGAATLDGNSQAAFTTSALSAGTHEITADYLGDANFGESAPASAFTQTVGQTGPAVGLSVSADPVHGQPVTVTATLPADATGSVDFQEGGTSIGQAQAYTSNDTALQFDGSSGYVAIPNMDMPNFTFSARVKLAASNGGQQVLIASENDGGWGVGINADGTLSLSCVGVSGDTVSSNAGITDTDWHQVAVSYSGSSVSFYLDGVLLDSTPCGVGRGVSPRPQPQTGRASFQASGFPDGSVLIFSSRA